MSETDLLALGRASAELAHELRNVLATIAVSAQAAAGDPQQAPRFLARIGKHAELGQRLVEDVLALASTTTVARESTDIRPLLEAARDTLETKGTTFRDEVDVETVPVHAALFGRLLHALYANAVAVGAKQVTTRVHAQGDSTWFDVTDDGPGVPVALQATLFEPFATGREGGTGLGLTLARRIAEAHDGRLTLLDDLGGTTFRIALSSR